MICDSLETFRKKFTEVIKENETWKKIDILEIFFAHYAILLDNIGDELVESIRGKPEEKDMKHTLKGEYSTRRIWLDDKELLPIRSQKVYNHSPDGFDWGYGGSGPAQLALAICIELGFETFPYQYLKWQFINKLPQGQDFEVDFEIIGEKIIFTLEEENVESKN